MKQILQFIKAMCREGNYPHFPIYDFDNQGHQYCQWVDKDKNCIGGRCYLGTPEGFSWSWMWWRFKKTWSDRIYL